jgi:hypothetical protein
MSAAADPGVTPSPVPSVVLTGRPRGVTALAVDVLRDLPAEFRLIGGLAVLCRVGVPHRATVDLDALARGLELFDADLRRLAVSAAGGGQYRMPGDLELDVIDVSVDDAERLLTALVGHGPPTDLELNVVAHTWAHDTATAVDITVLSDEDGAVLSRADARLVASPGGLVAMKATTVTLRASSKPEKRASDLYDLGRLVAQTSGARDLDAAPAELRAAVLSRLRDWFVDPRGRDRTYREVRRFDEAPLDLDEVAEIVDELDTR